jgi:hypothetical protein
LVQDHSAQWTQTLTPTTADFSTRVVNERWPGGGTDTCYFPKSTVDSFISSTTMQRMSGRWTVRTGNEWRIDQTGWAPSDITYYRRENRAPCAAKVRQEMSIDCPLGPYRYTENSIELGIDKTSRWATRNTTRTNVAWP